MYPCECAWRHLIKLILFADGCVYAKPADVDYAWKCLFSLLMTISSFYRCGRRVGRRVVHTNFSTPYSLGAVRNSRRRPGYSLSNWARKLSMYSKHSAYGIAGGVTGGEETDEGKFTLHILVQVQVFCLWQCSACCDAPIFYNYLLRIVYASTERQYCFQNTHIESAVAMHVDGIHSYVEGARDVKWNKRVVGREMRSTPYNVYNSNKGIPIQLF